jgi:hypothetical protein
MVIHGNFKNYYLIVKLNYLISFLIIIIIPISFHNNYLIIFPNPPTNIWKKNSHVAFHVHEMYINLN